MIARGLVERRGVRGARARALRALRWGSCVAVLVAMAGCAKPHVLHRPAPETLPPGSPLRSATLSDADAWLRHHLMYGEYPLALDLLTTSPAAPSDELVRALQQGVVLHRAGEYARSNEVLAFAELEAEERYTLSASRGLLSLGINDAVMAYTPSPTEMAMVPFYRMLNYLALGDLEGAMVEARKANALTGADGDQDERACREYGMLAYVAGLVQSVGGSRNDALVSLRHAERAFMECGVETGVSAPEALGADLYRAARAAGVGDVADSAMARYALNEDDVAAGGDVILFIEEGFVAHRAHQAIHVPIFPEEMDELDDDDADAVAVAAARITARLLENASDRAVWGSTADDLRVVRWANALSGAYILKLAWPAARRESVAPRDVRVFVGDSLAAVTTIGDLSALVEHDLQQERPLMLARLIGRGLVKYVAARELEQMAHAEGGELAGFLAGRLANAAANEMERADTRSWSLLPDRISIARLRLPAGTHRIRLDVVSEAGGTLTSRDLGEVEVVPGGLIAISERVWGK